MLTVRQLLDYLTGQPDETPVVVDVNAGGWCLRAEDLNVTTAQDATLGGDPLEGVEINIFWEPGERGWSINDPSETLFTLDDVDDLIAERDAASGTVRPPSRPLFLSSQVSQRTATARADRSILAYRSRDFRRDRAAPRHRRRIQLGALIVVPLACH
ncbi:hypothetical protein ACWDA3_50025 [Nonomuraea rubra]